MNPEAANTIIYGFLEGSFDILQSTLSLSFGSVGDMYNQSDIRQADAGAMQGFLKDYPVTARVNIAAAGGDGDGENYHFVLLFTLPDASRLAALVSGDEPEPAGSLDATAKQMFTELAEAFAGGGGKNLIEKSGRQDLEVKSADVVMANEEDIDLPELLGDPCTAVVFGFTLADTESNAVVLVPETAETIASPRGAALSEDDVESLVSGAQLNEAEMNDILSGFNPETAEEEIGAPGIGAGAAQSGKKAGSPGEQENLEMILDIKLEATARLGEVEMPLTDILALGPGSIIEVGHSVDEPVDLLVNGKLIARGDVVVVDEKFGLRITEIVSQQERIESLL